MDLSPQRPTVVVVLLVLVFGVPTRRAGMAECNSSLLALQAASRWVNDEDQKLLVLNAKPLNVGADIHFRLFSVFRAAEPFAHCFGWDRKDPPTTHQHGLTFDYRGSSFCLGSLTSVL